MAAELKAKFCRALEEGWNNGNLDAWDEFYAPDYVHHRPPLTVFDSLAAEKQDVANTLQAFTDSEITIHEILFDGNVSATRWTWRATHTGQSPTLPIPPTGKQVTLVGCNVSYWANGQVVEEWEYSDYLGLLMQLGVIPALG